MSGPKHALLSLAHLLNARLNCQPTSNRPLPTWFQRWHATLSTCCAHTALLDVSVQRRSFIEVSQYSICKQPSDNVFLLKKHVRFHLKSMISLYMRPPTRTGSRSRGCAWMQGKPCMLPVQSDPGANPDIEGPMAWRQTTISNGMNRAVDWGGATKMGARPFLDTLPRLYAGLQQRIGAKIAFRLQWSVELCPVAPHVSLLLFFRFTIYN